MKSAFWNSVYGLFFVALVLLGSDWLMKEGLLARYVSLGDFLLMALAIFRLIRLTSYDVITAFIRDGVANAPKDSLAGVASLIQILSNLIGWHAEGKKRQVQGQ